ncbi:MULTISPECIES: hypothetical protein [unclassified Arcicella]|uniref:hypothetical protein n=1 Tax=unclassified Arcicella TaxID=2644986 RepID=UPI00285607DD|nr:MULTISPECIES: hypothetical protein [unclassified Arcicella]MDR6560935.1 hypothetical protein [Arcicella sp. BE51]MDR6810819.1 hypothetical protein [Arcicella sp. BE140]MDR6822169.1 hypothetical protein [Arcicella sp. BE139]
MNIEVNEQYLALLYHNAKQSYKECISNEDNGFLKGEVSVHLESILLIENNIKIVFHKNISYNYLLEVSLKLYADDKEIGKYIY